MSPLLWAGLAVAVPFAAWWLWQRHRARTPSTDERDQRWTPTDAPWVERWRR